MGNEIRICGTRLIFHSPAWQGYEYSGYHTLKNKFISATNFHWERKRRNWLWVWIRRWRKGKGYDYEEALLNAIKDAKRNLVPIPLDLWMTNPLTLESKFNDFKLKITPRPKGFNSLGNPTMASMLILAGMMHCSFKCQSRNQVPYAMAYAFFKAVSM